MKWPVQQLMKYRHKDLTFDETVELSELENEKNDIRSLSPVRVTGEGRFSGNTLTFDLRIKGKMILPDSRTLADVDYPFDMKTEEMFNLNPSPYETEEEEAEIHPVTGDVLDLTPYIRENILLEIPMQVFSDEPDKGPAPQSGKDWEVVTEKENSGKIDPRLAELGKFFDKENE
ncbi:YceD family protein [Bacillus marinisedimentorum]|uniref:YceD family protein n=1 Tax=Bacillus marinisedimentorum TaxID=1821260 RepID=UPI00087346ED|nr:YceD family protein [Bacillus marinisedimentorum]